LFDDIVANQDLQLPGLEYFFGRERGMHELANYARPHFEKLVVKQRREAIDAINQIKSDIQNQYNKELKGSRNKIAVNTTKTFLKALKFRPNDNPNKVRGLENGILVHDRDTGMLKHVLPKQNLLYKGDTRHYFPSNNLSEKKTANEIGKSFAGSIKYRYVILNGKILIPQNTTNIIFNFAQTRPVKITSFPLGRSRVSLRANLFCCPDLKNFQLLAY